MVNLTSFQVDVCKAIRNNLSVLEPDLFLETRALPFPFERIDLNHRGLDRTRFLAHGNILAQKGYSMSCLNGVLAAVFQDQLDGCAQAFVVLGTRPLIAKRPR